MRGNKSINV